MSKGCGQRISAPGTSLLRGQRQGDHPRSKQMATQAALDGCHGASAACMTLLARFSSGGERHERLNSRKGSQTETP